MLLKPKNRKLIKNFLLAINIVLAIILLSLFFLGMLIIRPKLIDKATSIEQFLLLNLDYLPQGLDTIEPDYLGKKDKTVHNSNEDNTLNRDTKIITANFETGPKVAIILTNVGLNKRIDDLVLKMPAQVCYGITLYSNRIKSFIHNAQVNGHEIYLNLPLWEGNNFKNLEQNLLSPDYTIEENITRLNNLLNNGNNFAGVYSNLRETFTNNANAFQPLLKQIENKNLIFVLGKMSNTLAEEYPLTGSNLIKSSIIIDSEADEKKINENLLELVEIAKNNGSALGYANGYMITLELLDKWFTTLKANGIELVPVSSLIKEDRM